MNSNINHPTQDILKDLNSSIDSVRLNAARQLGNAGYSSVEILEALHMAKKNDKNKFIRQAATAAIKKLNAVAELTGTDRPLSELSDRELLERLLLLQIENKKYILAIQSLVLFLLSSLGIIYWLTKTP